MDREALIPLFDVRLRAEEIDAVSETLRSGWLTMGPRTQEFESAFAEHLGCRHAVAVASGTAALHLALLAAGVGPGDEVIVPDMTFVATANAVRYCGGTPVLADIVSQSDPSLDPEQVRALLTPRTKAICVVHYGGYAADVSALQEIARASGVALVEDAAHAPHAEAREDSRRLGTWGLAGAFSFFTNKVLGCGEGGLLATDDDEVAELARRLRSHGMTSGTWDRHRGHALGYDVEGLGFNYRLDEPRAALLLARLNGLAEDVERRRELTRRYRALLAGVDGVAVPYDDADVARSSCYVMPVTLESAEQQEAVRRDMLEAGRVQTSTLYPAIHEFSAYRHERHGPLPRSELFARTQVTLPLHPYLSEPDQDRVVESLVQALARAADKTATRLGEPQ
jgi:dTDP-4-amino-4,6-dideoxygalactose transaminase